jgi:hypothetical protein
VTRKAFLGELAGVFLHLACVLLGACTISVALKLATDSLVYGLHPQPRFASSSSILNPVFWLPGLFIGGIVNRLVRHRWAYLAPATFTTLFLILIMFWEVSLFRNSEYSLNMAHGHPWRYEFERLFSSVSGSSPDKTDKVITQLIVTLPFLDSLAYAVGGWFGLRFGEPQKVPSSPEALGEQTNA